MKLVIVKIGGAIIDDDERLQALLRDVTAVGHPCILVHGGGNILTEYSRMLGIEVEMREGRRRTDAATRDLALMVYGGLINKRIVAALQSFGCNAIGMTGADANVISAVRRPEVDGFDFGFVGDISAVNTEVIEALLRQNLLPVISPLTHDGNGAMLNTNADTIATSVAIALARRWKVHVHFCFDRDGVSNGERVLNSLSYAGYLELRARGVVTDGMIPKLDAAFAALQNGVARIAIHSPDALASSLAGESAGTELLMTKDTSA